MVRTKRPSSLKERKCCNERSDVYCPCSFLPHYYTLSICRTLSTALSSCIAVLEGKDLLSPLFRRLFCENQTWLSAVERLTRDHYCCSSLGYHQKHVIDAKFMCWSLDLHHCNSDNRARTAHAEKTVRYWWIYD